MATPTFDNFSLQDSNYLTTDVEYRTIPARDIILENIARRPGKKILSHEFIERRIRLVGWILGDDSSDLIDKIDDLHSNLSRKKSGTLSIDTGREITAIVAAVTIPEPHYTQSAVPFEMEFLAAEPFWKGTEQIVNFVVTSGTSEPHTQQFSLTVSGSVFAEPSITYNAPSGSGTTTTSGIKIEYELTAESVTWSGGDNALAYGSLVKFDYENYFLLEDSSKVENAGIFSRWEPGSTDFTCTFSGQAQGGTLNFVYRPRYL